MSKERTREGRGLMGRETSGVEELCESWERAYPKDLFPEHPSCPKEGAMLAWIDPDTGEQLSDPFHLGQASAAMGRFMARALRRVLDRDGEPRAEETSSVRVPTWAGLRARPCENPVVQIYLPEWGDWEDVVLTHGEEWIFGVEDES